MHAVNLHWAPCVDDPDRAGIVNALEIEGTSFPKTAAGRAWRTSKHLSSRFGTPPDKA